ncbi:hypothetical protein Fcan01_02737 [Folsomia candida]|uniref:Uncharacterized protein n=1 Tax=Folsomia candida TaxID=158441 RepID=A0A226F1I4_FOLCA|nr:hypothetical protein Fcan01_02737 [Folsomia candida]
MDGSLAARFSGFLSSIFVFLELLGKVIGGKSQASDFRKDTEIFYSCNGKPTAAGVFTQDKITTMATCLTGVARPKYCMYKCMLQNMGMIESSGKPNYTMVQYEMEKYKLFKDNTADVIKAAKECGVAGRNYASEERGCRNVREFYYCIYNKYLKICNKASPPKDINHASEEDGLVEKTVGTADAVSTAVLN